MEELRAVGHAILAAGRADGPELEELRRQLYSGGKIGAREADFLVALHRRVRDRTAAFERFFYRAVKDHLLAHGRLDAEEAAWLRRMIFPGGRADDEGRRFLRELKAEAGQIGVEFDALLAEVLDQSPQRRPGD